MLDVVDFRRLLGHARSMLDIYSYGQTLSYTHAHDKGMPVDYVNKYSLLQWLDRWTPQRAEMILREDLQGLRDGEVGLVERMWGVYRDFGRTLSTTREWYCSKGAIYETLLDYRYFNEHLPKDFCALDFGPGCGRHGLGYLLTDRQGVYVGLECVEVLYMLQNAILSFAARGAFREYVDFVIERLPFPNLTELPPGTLVHMPSWESDVLEGADFDVIIACHVLDELPVGDVERFLNVVERCLKPRGIVYARGTLANRSKVALPSYHGVDIPARLGQLGFRQVVNDEYRSQAYNVILWQRPQ
jgi:SAM-dependent methyltransferase